MNYFPNRLNFALFAWAKENGGIHSNAGRRESNALYHLYRMGPTGSGGSIAALWAYGPSRQSRIGICAEKYGLGMAAGNPAPIAPVHALGNRQYPPAGAIYPDLPGQAVSSGRSETEQCEGGFHHQYIPSDDHRAAHDPDWRVLVGYSDTDEQAFMAAVLADCYHRLHTDY